MDGQMGDQDRCHPNGYRGDDDLTLGHPYGVIEWICDGDVSVHADAAEVEEGCSGKEDVIGVEHVTGQSIEHPSAMSLIWTGWLNWINFITLSKYVSK